MNIETSHREKKIVRLTMKLALAKFGTSHEKIHNELSNSSNPAIELIVSTIDKALSNLKCKKEIARNIPELAIWILIHSKRYKDILPNMSKALLGAEYIQEDTKKLSYLDDVIISIIIKHMYKQLDGFFTFREIIKDTIDYANPALNYIYKEFNKNVNLDSVWKQIHVDALTRLFLWFAQRDTAYRDMFFWIIYHIGNIKLKKLTKPYVKPPEKWYGNLWIDGQELTKKKRKKGEISEYEFSEIERLCVPSIRSKEINDIVRRGK